MSSPEPSPTPKAPARSAWATASRFSYVGIFFGVAIMIGFAAGRFIEKRWGGAPWVSLVGVLFGVATGFRELVRIARAYSKDMRT
jgi:F0F1-type ATP synthase assembly protein I